MAKSKIPKCPDEITNSWLNDLLRRSGKLEKAAVVNLSIEPLTIQIGSANIVRIILQYDFPENGLLSSMIVKFVSIHKIPHAEKLRTYWDREVNFYNHLGSNSGISTPQCIYAELDKRSGDYLLLMEDMSKCRVGDFFGNIEDVQMAIQNLARFHAKRWNNKLLDEMPWGTFFSPVLRDNEPLFKTFADSLFHIKEIYDNEIP